MQNSSDLERRKQVSFNAFYFEQEKKKGNLYSNMRDVFSKIDEINLWGALESASGEGSTDRQTAKLKIMLPQLLSELKIQTLIDAPCGDFGWLSTIPLPIKQYIGLDVLPRFADHHTAQYAHLPNFNFFQADITTDPLPPGDLIFCRDCLVHFSNEDIFLALKNFKRSRAQYLLTTTFTETKNNGDIVTGDWRPLNLEQSPFNLPKPKKLLVEGCIEGIDLYSDKSLGLWDLHFINFT